MATKPTSGTAPDTGNALYPHPGDAWAFPEGSGTTSADSEGVGKKDIITFLWDGTSYHGGVFGLGY